MDRSNEQIIGDIAETIFAGALPPEWVTRPLPKDYGIDFSVEVFELNKSTGIIFDIQLKGSSKISFNSNGSHISFSIELKYLEYYLEQYQRPVFLVLCDVKTNAVYWLEMQSNKDLNAAYEKARGKQKSLSLHIPVCNRLPGTEKALLEAYQAMMVKVAARWNGKVSTPPDTGAPKVAMPRIPFPAAAGIAAALLALLLISW
ncbi:MAG: DUF4365 domain-containing protein, partial [bacterium]|nr:DUF4365 domain-containing protein [bacterium]